MKTPTKSNIINIIEENGPIRPTDLSKVLKISLQAVHKHLKSLVADGTLEPKGSPPFTQYAISGTPNFTNAFEWYKSLGPPNFAEEVCETRDVFSARLSRLILFTKDGLPKEDLPLVISVIGEIGNNSFDHNLGQWKDVPGCWFEGQATRSLLWLLIADRGQGIFRSLFGTTHVQNEQEAVEKAFTKHISGRAPEKRGNGLKYVANVIKEKSVSGLVCRSGSGEISLGTLKERCENILKEIRKPNEGTITIIAWELK